MTSNDKLLSARNYWRVKQTGKWQTVHSLHAVARVPASLAQNVPCAESRCGHAAAVPMDFGTDSRPVCQSWLEPRTTFLLRLCHARYRCGRIGDGMQRTSTSARGSRAAARCTRRGGASVRRGRARRRRPTTGRCPREPSRAPRCPSASIRFRPGNRTERARSPLAAGRSCGGSPKGLRRGMVSDRCSRGRATNRPSLRPRAGWVSDRVGCDERTEGLSSRTHQCGGRFHHAAGDASPRPHALTRRPVCTPLFCAS